MNPKRIARSLLRKSGFDIVRYPTKTRGPFDDMADFLVGTNDLMVLDVGGNVGQSVKRFRGRFPQARIHSFEPSPGAYAQLEANCSSIPGVTTWNCAMGSVKGRMPLLENDASDMTSFHEPGTRAWGKVSRTTVVDVQTLDSFAAEQGIERVDVLKSDTQGFEFEVLSGAKGLMSEDRIAMVYLEMIFSDMYKTMPPVEKVLGLLSENGFLPVNFYEPNLQGGLLSWMDALFINRRFYVRAPAKSDRPA